MLNLDLSQGLSADQRRRTLGLLRGLNEAAVRGEDPEYAYDLAFKMQIEAPAVFDIFSEPEEMKELYGIGKEPTDDYGRRCLLARRMVEKGVRFVCVVLAEAAATCSGMLTTISKRTTFAWPPKTDKPVAGLIRDLKRRGLLDQTLVLWGGEFGRSPEAQGGKGRDHHNLRFTMWMAGGGIKGGQVVGATDEIGLRAIEQPHHFRTFIPRSMGR